MNTSTMGATNISRTPEDYIVVAPISMTFAIIAVLISCLILILVLLKKQLHTMTHLLICNTCVSSIIYCIVQCNNYIYLSFITWDTSDRSCRWRGYFTYMSVAAVIYSYLLQAISRLFFTVLSAKYRWLVSLKTHSLVILINWMIVLVVALPALVTNDIYFRAGFFCWVPKKCMLHIGYTIIAYYLTPILLTTAIYLYIYVRLRSGAVNTKIQRSKRRQNRDLEVLRNIMILLSIYIIGAVPSVVYMLAGIEVFYSIGIISMSLTVTTEKIVSIIIDREVRNTLRKYFYQSKPQFAALVLNISGVNK